MVHRLAVAASLTLLASASASAQDARALYVKSLAATCANCHGTNGRALVGAGVPGLAGMPAPYMVQQLKTFKDGTRPSTVMQQLTKGYNDSQIEAIAAYFAAQPK